MALNISAGAIRNPIPPIVLFLALIFAGLTAYFRLPINQVPNIEFPVFTVTVAQPGAAPAEMETQIAQKVEATLTSVQGVKRITSRLRPGASTTIVELQIGADISRAVEDARDAMSRIRQNLPADISEPLIERQEAAAEPIAYYALQAPAMSPQDMSWFIDNTLSRDLLAVRGISAVQRLGGVEREIRVELDPDRMLAFGIAADQVSRQLRSQNIDLPGGQAQIGGQAQSIRTLGGAERVEDLAEARLVASGGRAIKLKDIATVTDAASEITAVSRYHGQPAISFLVQRAKGASEVAVYDSMVAKLRDIEKKTPGVRFIELGTPVGFIKGMHESSILALIEGAALATLVVFLILRDWRATVLAAVAIPLATIPTFALIEPLGFTLNMITLIALGLVAGVLVDDAIVEIENIVRHIRMGKKPYEAALEAADEIGLAVVATSATIIAVFLPVSFMTGVTGQFFKEFGITVAIAVFFSLAVARLITPLMAAYFMKDSHHEEKPSALRDAYEGALRWSIRRPWIAAAAGVAIFAASLFIATKVPMTFIPRLDNGSIQAKVEFPPGWTVQQADATLQKLSSGLLQDKDVIQVFTNVGSVNGGATDGSMYVELADRAHRMRTAYEIQQALRPVMLSQPDVRATFQNFQGGGRGADVTVEFVGDDPAKVEAQAEALSAQMRALPELADVRASSSLKRPEIQIRPRSDEAARLGVSSAALASAVRIATSGDVDQNLAKYTLADRQVPIRVLLRPDARADLDTIRALRVESSNGSPVRLDAVADVTFGIGEATIERRDRQRSVTVSANVVQGQPGDAVKKVFALPAAKSPAPGVKLVLSGDTEESQDMFRQFGNAMLWGILLIYGVLVLLFRDFFQPITIMTALPLSIGGAFIGLLIANQPLSLFALIGLLMLMGIVTKNSILLVDFAIEQIRLGKARNEALFEAGVKRARPIIMTTIAMSAGMIPAAAGWGVDGALRQGMGVAVIGGLILSTLLSLLFVPAVFVLIDRLERLVKPIFARLSTREPGADPARHPAG
jgi:HAE1 family hydrophobic/amphiphilic exporter-1